MGLFDFVKNAGSSIFGAGEDEKPDFEPIKPFSIHLREHGIDPTGITFDLKNGHLVVAGTVPDQATKESVIMLCGNVNGVATCDDQLQVASAPVSTSEAEPATAGADATPSDWASDTYTVKSGDSLSKIAKEIYGDPMKYTVIFEANTPMLKDPDKIYPGQVLRIPAAD